MTAETDLPYREGGRKLLYVLCPGAGRNYVGQSCLGTIGQIGHRARILALDASNTHQTISKVGKKRAD